MFKTILVPTDGSPLSEKVVTAALEFARSNGSKLIGLCVAELYPMPLFCETGGGGSGGFGSDDSEMEKWARSNVQKIAISARQAGVECEVFTTQAFNPAEEIINTAKKMKCDVIFMATHGRKGLDKLFIGSETQKVLARTTIPVLVFR